MTYHALRDAGFAPCATTDPEVFHDDTHADVAKRLCAECPLTAYCRAQARTNRERGAWGGETSEERATAGHPPRGWRTRSPSAQRRPPNVQEMPTAA